MRSRETQTAELNEENTFRFPLLADASSVLQLVLVPVFILLALAAAGCVYLMID